MLEALNYEYGSSEVRRTSNIVPTDNDKQKSSQILSSRNVPVGIYICNTATTVALTSSVDLFKSDLREKVKYLSHLCPVNILMDGDVLQMVFQRKLRWKKPKENK